VVDWLPHLTARETNKWKVGFLRFGQEPPPPSWGWYKKPGWGIVCVGGVYTIVTWLLCWWSKNKKAMKWRLHSTHVVSREGKIEILQGIWLKNGKNKLNIQSSKMISYYMMYIVYAPFNLMPTKLFPSSELYHNQADLNIYVLYSFYLEIKHCRFIIFCSFKWICALNYEWNCIRNARG
jgi:hypothetical protein